jgi:DNA replication protein DnaC
MKDMTSTENGNSIFKRDVVETSICKCGHEYESHFKTFFSGIERVHRIEMCHECHEKKQDEEMRQEWDRQQLKEHLKIFNSDSLLNDKLKQACFDSYHPTNEQLTKAKTICERYANNFEINNAVNLLLIGGYGTGKSHLAVSIAKEVMHNKYKSALFISTPKLLTRLRSTYSWNSRESEEQIINQLSRVSLLVLDDLGSEQSKPTGDSNEQSWALSKIFEIIDNRIGRHTIFTTNFDLNELQQRLGGRNFSRMMENTHVVKMYGKDYRLRTFE